ncbi:MAG: heme peroxidase family protein [Actinomycetota bacterium]|nr:heme peroxidase family protein [Actinomycetota bacterium]
MPAATDARRTPPHGRSHFPIEGEGPAARAAAAAEAPEFRFSRMGPAGPAPLPAGMRKRIAGAMIGTPGHPSRVPAGYTYLGQFVDHDLTFDKTVVTLGDQVSPAHLLQGRSPTLDLDSLYGAGPGDPVSAEFYADDRHLKVGKTVRTPPDAARVGFDLARTGTAETGPNRRRALIPDPRNDENLAVAQHHLAMIRFHNRVADTLGPATPANERFARARRLVVLHYQWMLRTDYLRRICDRAVVDDVFANGRKVFEVGASPFAMPTMPVEFSVAAFRLGHSMIRRSYDWNVRFPDNAGTLDLLFTFSGTSGVLGGGDRALPSNWIADWRRLYSFSSVGRPDLKPPPGAITNLARGIDTVLAEPLESLPPGSFDGTDADFGTIQANLAFRNLTRAGMVRLASGQQMVNRLKNKGVPVTKLTATQLIEGEGGAVLTGLSATQRRRFLDETPLWFYILREAELNGGKLTGVGARIVAETFHRAMEGSTFSIVRNSEFRPRLGAVSNRFTMADLLLFAFDGNSSLLAPLGD